MRITLTRLTLTTAVRVIDRVHHHAANMGTLSLPSRATRLPDHNVFMVYISDLTNRCHTGRQDLPHFSGLEADLNISPITPHHLSRTTGTSNQLTTLARF